MKELKPVLVIGATGFLGTEICRQLREAGKSVRALVRTSSDPSKIKTLQQLGVDTVVGDIKDFSSVREAMNGVGSVISTASSTISHQEGDSIESVDKTGQLNVIKSAEQAGIEKFVFISFPESKNDFPLQDAKREAENKLDASSLNYTVLRPSYFMEIWLGPALGFDAANHKATIYGHGASRISWISIKDVAAFAVSSLDNAAADNTIIEIGGPEALSPLEVVSIFEQETGKKFDLQHVPEEALQTQFELSSDSLQKSFAALMLDLNTGYEIEMKDTLDVFPMELVSVREYCRNVLKGNMSMA
jgi:uncharacterized protein YbjT (DUF2867 family)